MAALLQNSIPKLLNSYGAGILRSSAQCPLVAMEEGTCPNSRSITNISNFAARLGIKAQEHIKCPHNSGAGCHLEHYRVNSQRGRDVDSHASRVFPKAVGPFVLQRHSRRSSRFDLRIYHIAIATSVCCKFSAVFRQPRARMIGSPSRVSMKCK